MIVKIVCASTNSFSKLYNKDDDEFIIGCDGGCKVLEDLNINYDLALGDFDSFSESLINPNITKIKFKSEKDESDLELALDYALKLDPEKILIYNATGKRIDHLLASINLLKKFNIDYEPIEKIYQERLKEWKEILNDGKTERIV